MFYCSFANFENKLKAGHKQFPFQRLLSVCLMTLNFELFFGLSAFAQTDSIETQALEPIVVEALKIPKPWLKSSTSTYLTSPESKDQQAQNSLQEFLWQTPSIYSLNANNRAQDLRIAIRGFGSRASFGVRGVKIIVDGIPETTTDGQGQLDNLNLGIIDRIEVLNGGASGLYGNASGGVINIITAGEEWFESKDRFATLGLGFHSFSGQQYQFTVGQKLNKHNIIFHGNHHQGKGYRDHSRFQSTNFNLKVTSQLSEQDELQTIVNYMDSPLAEDPGGVTLSQYDSLPTSARVANEQLNAGEAINQFKTSLNYKHRFNESLHLNATGFYSRRSFEGRIPVASTGAIDLGRDFYGHAANFSGRWAPTSKKLWNWQSGYDIQFQRDQRLRFENLNGTAGTMVLDQKERFANIGIYGLSDFQWDSWVFNVSVRYDFNAIRVDDTLLDNGDDSGEIDLNNINYSMGLAYAFHPLHTLFVNHSTSFETPTLNELSNNPNGGGFNSSLKPKQANHFELGIKGAINGRTIYQLSGYFILSEDELLPFEIESEPGRTFFRNVGNTERKGIEWFISHSLGDVVKLSTSWSLQNFSFTDYVVGDDDFEGNRLPGLPNYQGFIQVDVALARGLNLLMQNQWSGNIYADDENSEQVDSFMVTNLSLKYDFAWNHVKWSPYFGVNNLFQTQYPDNIRINAFGGRYYEAAPDIFFFGGLRANF